MRILAVVAIVLLLNPVFGLSITKLEEADELCHQAAEANLGTGAYGQYFVPIIAVLLELCDLVGRIVEIEEQRLELENGGNHTN